MQFYVVKFKSFKTVAPGKKFQKLINILRGMFIPDSRVGKAIELFQFEAGSLTGIL